MHEGCILYSENDIGIKILISKGLIRESSMNLIINDNDGVKLYIPTNKGEIVYKEIYREALNNGYTV